MSKSLHITFGLAGYYPQNYAGTESYVRNLAHYLYNSGYRVSIVIPDPSGELTQYSYEDIPVYPFQVSGEPNAAEMNGLKSPKGIDAFRDILHYLQPDIFHLHSLNRALDSRHLQVAMDLGIKTVFTGHLGGTFCVKGNLLLYGRTNCDGTVINHRCTACYLKSKGMSRVVSEIAAFFLSNLKFSKLLAPKRPAYNLINYKERELSTLKHADRVIALSPWMETAYKNNGFANVSLVSQGINTKIFTESAQRKNDVLFPLNLLFAGRMHPDKGIHIVLKALEHLHPDDRRQINLTIATIPFSGQTGYYNEMYEMYAKMGYRRWYKNAKPGRIVGLMNESDLLILSSLKNEAAPLVILEAFSQKLPVLGSDYIAIRDMVRDNYTGKLFQNGNSRDLATKLYDLLREPTLLAQWKANIPKVRSTNDIGKDMASHYADIMNGK